MKRHVHIITSQNIDGKEICDMEMEELQENGVHSLLDQKKLMIAISQLKSRKCNSVLMLDVERFLQSEPDFKQYVPMFKNNKVSGEILLECTVPILQEIGVESVFHASRIIILFRKYMNVIYYDSEDSKRELIRRVGLAGIKNKEQYLQVIKEKDLNEHLLKEGKEELLVELGFSIPDSKSFMRKLKKISQ